MNDHTEDGDAELLERPHSGNVEVYRYGPLYRWGAYGTAGIVVLSLIAISGTAVIKGLSEMNWGAYAGAVAGLVGTATSVPTLLSELYLTKDRLLKERPLRADQEVHLDEVRRVFVGGASVELYVSSGADAALTFDRKVQGGDDLIEKLVGRLPVSAEVDHPSGELKGRLADA